VQRFEIAGCQLSMKHWLFSILFGFCLVFISCNKVQDESDCSIKLGKPFTIPQGYTYCSSEESFSIRFEKVENESRCPQNVVCIWQGMATVKLVFSKNEIDYPFSVSTLRFGNYHTDTLVAGYKIKLLLLNPYPKAGKPIPQKDYRAELVITK
jgi:hypothetical protein